jgi:hypothetical protein
MNTRLINKFLNIVALLVPGLMLVATLHEGTRLAIREFLEPEQRILLSTAFGNVLGDGTPVRVMKIKTRDSLVLEIYKANDYQLIQRISLDQKKDGFFTFHGEATNLVLVDVDGDDIPEILAPGYDHNLSAQLNVYHYDRDTKLFHRLMDEYEIKMLSDL